MDDYNQALKKLNDAENVYDREIGMLNRIINNDKIEKNKLRNDIKNLENTIQEKLNEIEETKNISENDKKILQAKIDDIIDDNDKLEDFIELYNDIVKEEEHKIYNKLDKLNNEKINIKKELDAVKNERDNLLLKYDTKEEADINERRKKIKKMILIVNMIVMVLINMIFIKILMNFII